MGATVLLPWAPPTASFVSSKLRTDSRQPFLNSLSFRASINCYCVKNEDETNSFKEFSVLRLVTPCDAVSTWTSMAFYMFSVHIPLSFGGLSIAAKLLHQPVLDPQTEALLILAIQTLELSVVLLLLKYSGEPWDNILNFFQAKKLSEQRNWLLASALGFGFLVLLVLVTSVIADRLIGPKDINNPILKEILSSSSASLTAIILTYCLVTPLLEEIVYRGFLLTSLASTMKWNQAVIISCFLFSAAHFSAENSLQLFIIGSILGFSYCWTGDLRSSFVIHSMYNALILFFTLIS